MMISWAACQTVMAMGKPAGGFRHIFQFLVKKKPMIALKKGLFRLICLVISQNVSIAGGPVCAPGENKRFDIFRVLFKKSCFCIEISR